MERVRSKPIAALDTPLPSAREPFPSDELRTRSTALAAALAPLPLDQRLQLMRREVRGPIVFTTSFGLEDQAILHAMRQQVPDRRGDRHPRHRPACFPRHTTSGGERAALRHRIRSIYPQPRARGRSAWSPRKGSTASLVRVDARKACCHVRKVEPLKRALAGAAAWITGLQARPVATRAAASSCAMGRGPRHSQSQSARRLDARGGARAYIARAQRSGQCRCMRKGFASIGCAAVHARHRAGRARARRPLVVGTRTARRNVDCTSAIARAPRWTSRKQHA